MIRSLSAVTVESSPVSTASGVTANASCAISSMEKVSVFSSEPFIRVSFIRFSSISARRRDSLTIRSHISSRISTMSPPFWISRAALTMEVRGVRISWARASISDCRCRASSRRFSSLWTTALFISMNALVSLPISSRFPEGSRARGVPLRTASAERDRVFSLRVILPEISRDSTVAMASPPRQNLRPDAVWSLSML